MCKTWKVNGFRIGRADGEKFSDHRRRLFAAEAVRAATGRLPAR